MRAAFIFCKCGKKCDNDFNLSMHKLRSVFPSCKSAPVGKTTQHISTAPSRRPLPWHVKPSTRVGNLAVSFDQRPDIERQTQAGRLSPSAGSRPEEKDTGPLPFNEYPEPTLEPVSPHEAVDKDCDEEEPEPVAGSPQNAWKGPFFHKRKAEEDVLTLRQSLEEMEVVEAAERVLSIDDATADEMAEAFMKLMDINADHAGIKTTDRIMKLVLHPAWTEKQVAKKIRNAKLATVTKIRERIQREVEKELLAEGFVEVEVNNPENDQEFTVVWVRSALSQLKTQLAEAITEGPRKNFHVHPFHAKNKRGEPCVSHPMSAQVAHESIPLLIQSLKRARVNIGSTKSQSCWTPVGSHVQGESCVLLGQFYSDASSMTLSTNSLTFYPLQLTCLNFDQKTKDNIVASGEAVIAYLSTDKTWRRRVDKALEVQRGFDGDDGNGRSEKSRKESRTEKHTDRSSGNIPPEIAACYERKIPRTSYEVPDSDSEDSLASVAEEDSSDDEAEDFTGQDYLKRNKDEEIISQRLFAACFRKCTEEVKSQAKAGILFRSKNGKLYKGHLPIASYVADSPEINHVACVKKGLCHRCVCEREDLNGKNGRAQNVPARDIRVTKSICDEYERARSVNDRKARDAAMTRFMEYHVHAMFPVIAGWPFSQIPGFHTYEIFRFDHMHSHPLGLCVHLLKLLHRRVNRKDITTNNRTKVNKDKAKFVMERTPLGQKDKSLASRRNIILSACNWLLRSTQRDCPQNDFRIDFTRKKKAGTLNALFTDKGIVSMLEANHYKSITEVLPFIGAITDRLCNQLKTSNGPKWDDVKPLLTPLFVAYTDMDAAQTRRGCVDKSYTRAQLEDLRKKKERFSELVLSDDIIHLQKSKFNVEKFHKSDKHALIDIIKLGFYACYDSSVFESSHVVFKRLLRATSQRHCTGMGEATKKMTKLSAQRADENSMNPRDALVHSMVHGHVKVKRNYTQVSDIAKSSDSTVLVNRGKTFSLSTLMSIMENVNIGVENWKTFLSSKGGSNAFNGLLGGGDFDVTNEFIRACGGPNFLAKPVADILYKQSTLPYDQGPLLPDEFIPLSVLYNDFGYALSSVKIKVVKSAFSPSINTPTLLHVRSDTNTITLEDNGDRHLSRIVSALNWSHSQTRRQDNILVEGSADLRSSDRMLWPAKCLGLVRISAPKGFFSNPSNQERAVIRYYEVIPTKDLHRVDKDLGCVKLKWAELPNGDPWVDVVRADSIRGVFHCVPDGMHILSEPENEAQAENCESWRDRRFYINRFKTCQDEAYYLNC